jgi:hypothetical protein
LGSCALPRHSGENHEKDWHCIDWLPVPYFMPGRYSQSELDALLQAANEAALREALSQVWDDWNAPIGDLASPYVAGTIADRIARLIPQPSALDKRLAEARLKIAERMLEMFNDGMTAEKIGNQFDNLVAELRRAVKGEPDA